MSNNLFLEYLGRFFSIEEYAAKVDEVEVHLAAQGIFPTEFDWFHRYEEHVLQVLWLEAILDEA